MCSPHFCTCKSIGESTVKKEKVHAAFTDSKENKEVNRIFFTMVYGRLVKDIAFIMKVVLM